MVAMKENKKIRKLLGGIVPLSILGFLLILFFTFVLHFENKTILRSVSLAPYPNGISLKTIMDGKYQKNLSKWITDNFYGHSIIVKCHNQIEYSVFNDANGDWILGKNGYLYSKSQTQNFVGGGRDAGAVAEAYDTYAKNVYQLQLKLKQNGKDFFYIINPIKAEIYPENLPWYERIVEERNTKRNLNDSELLHRSFDKYGVNYFDTTDDLMEMKQEKDFDIFTKTGHHWTLTAVTNELNSIFANMKSVTPAIDYPVIDNRGIENKFFISDKDIFDIQNVFRGQLSKEYNMPIWDYAKKVIILYIYSEPVFSTRLWLLFIRARGSMLLIHSFTRNTLLI